MTAALQTNVQSFWAELWHILVPLLIAVFCGGAIGVERESGDHPAGLRTHVLVCVGSALVMHVSLAMYDLSIASGFGNGDPGRIAAQVVSGIGFLGAGTIMREGPTIRGLTTAASLWVVAGIGLAVGTALYLESLVSTVLVVLVLKTLSEVERRWIRKGGLHSLVIHVADTPGRLGALATACGKHGASIKGVSMRAGPVPSTVEISFRVKTGRGAQDSTALIGDLMATEGVISVTEEE